MMLITAAVLLLNCRVVHIPSAKVGAQYTQPVTCSEAKRITSDYLKKGEDAWVQHQPFKKVVVPSSATVEIVHDGKEGK